MIGGSKKDPVTRVLGRNVRKVALDRNSSLGKTLSEGRGGAMKRFVLHK